MSKKRDPVSKNQQNLDLSFLHSRTVNPQREELSTCLCTLCSWKGFRHYGLGVGFRSKAEVGIISGREIYDREKEMERETGVMREKRHLF